MMTFMIGKFKGIPDVIRKFPFGEDSGEFVIKNTVILRGNFTSVRIENKVNGSGMKSADP